MSVNIKVEPIRQVIDVYWESCVLTLQNGQYGLVINYKPVRKTKHQSKVIKQEFDTPPAAQQFAAEWIQLNRHEYEPKKRWGWHSG